MTESSASAVRSQRFRPDWVNLTTVVTVHALAIFAIVYMAAIQFSWWTLGLGVLWFFACGFSITAGYHRLFAHRTYEANPLVRLFFLLFGAASVQNSALKWASDHRTHHSRCDTEKDPYNIKKGFWWAHIGWVITANKDGGPLRRKDLEADPLVMFQHRWLVPLTVLVGAVLPFALGYLWGDPFGALLVAGFLRLAFQWHVTFAINSYAHTFGRQNYGTKTTARDSVVLALISLGEGYHSFHHTFPADYRNGVRWHHFDPTKWLIWSLSRVRMTTGLRRTASERIQRARAEASRRAQAVREAARAGVDAAKATVDAAANSRIIAAAGTRAAGVPRASDRTRETSKS